MEDSLLLVERINGFHSASFQVAFLKAVEDAGELENNSAIDAYRILQIELERIRSNISVIERMSISPKKVPNGGVPETPSEDISMEALE